MGRGPVSLPLSICLLVHLSQLLSFFSLLPIPSSVHVVPVSPVLLILWPPLPTPPTPRHLHLSLPSGARRENTTRARPCLAHTRCHGMVPLPAQGKPRAWPTPHSPPSPWKIHWPVAWLAHLGAWLLLLPSSSLGHLCLLFHTQRQLLESRVGGLVALGGRGGVGSWGRPSTPCSSLSGPPHPRASSRIPAASQSSGCYDSDSLELPRPEEGTPEDSGPGGLGTRVQAANGGSDRAQPPRSSGLRRQAIQNWQRRPRRHSTEGEEGDVSDVGSRTTESEAEGPSDAPRPGPAVAGPLSSCRLSGESWEGGLRGQSFHSAGPSQGTQSQGIHLLGSCTTIPFALDFPQ